MSLNATQLFALLPAVYQTRDAAYGGPLQALFGVMAAQSAVVEDNIQQLYDDQFIETCAPWVIPYIGDLVGYNSIYEVASSSSDSRAEVAHTIGYRRRKGTLVALEQMSIDVSGGRAVVVVEEFRRLITTESMRHIRPCDDATVNLRRGRALEQLGTAFDVYNRTIDVRRIAPRVREVPNPDTAPLDIALHGPGRFNIPDIAIHLWRWQSWSVTNAPAFTVGHHRYLFSPLGNNIPLFPATRSRTPFTPMTRADVPQPIGRHELSSFYGPAGSILLIADGAPVDVSQVYGANLSDRPGGSWCTVASGKIAIDPELGRIQYADDVPPPASLRLVYSYGFPAAIGGGPYNRSASLTQLDPTGAGFFAVVGSPEFPTVESAVGGWNQSSDGASGIIVVPRFESLAIDLTGSTAIQLPADSSLVIAAAEPVTAGGARDVIWSNSRVTLTGNIEVVAGSPAAGSSAPAGQLTISGVWIAGQLRVNAAHQTAPATGTGCCIQIVDSTLVPGLGLHPDGQPVSPGDPSIIVTAPATTLVLNRVISGPIAADSSGTTRICGSVIDATAPFYVAYAAPDLTSAGPDLHVEDSTIIGRVRTRTMTLASNTIFHARLGRHDPWPAAIWSSRRQAGCIRFCLLPYDSITPRRYHCLPPDDASESALEPQFITARYGQPSYTMLSGDTPMAVWTGAANGSQLGVYLQTQETESVANVQLRAPEYLPALLECGIFLHPSRPLREHRPPPIPYGYGYGSPRRIGHAADLDDDAEFLPGIGANLI
jgi:hypothetical protein